jgi:hypothetical protein
MKGSASIPMAASIATDAAESQCYSTPCPGLAPSAPHDAPGVASLHLLDCAAAHAIDGPSVPTWHSE